MDEPCRMGLPGWYVPDGTSRLELPGWDIPDGTSQMGPTGWDLVWFGGSQAGLVFSQPRLTQSWLPFNTQKSSLQRHMVVDMERSRDRPRSVVEIARGA